MEKHMTPEDIRAMERIERINFMNTVSGFRGATLIGTMSHHGVPNLAMFNSLVHIGASPPLLGFMVRPLTVPRHTYHNIKARRYFTVNLVHAAIVRAAHQTSANYATGISEFDACGLTPQYTGAHPAPYVQESRIRIGLKYVEEHLIRANESILVVGEVVELFVPADAVGPKGHVNLEHVDAVAVAGLDTYYRSQRLSRLGYARPGKEPGELDES